MTTTTKPTTASGQLRKLQAERDQLHAKVREAKDKIAAYDADTQAKRVDLSQRQQTNPDEWEGTPKRAKPNNPRREARGRGSRAVGRDEPARGGVCRGVWPVRES